MRSYVVFGVVGTWMLAVASGAVAAEFSTQSKAKPVKIDPSTIPLVPSSFISTRFNETALVFKDGKTRPLNAEGATDWEAIRKEMTGGSYEAQNEDCFIRAVVQNGTGGKVVLAQSAAVKCTGANLSQQNVRFTYEALTKAYSDLKTTPAEGILAYDVVSKRSLRSDVVYTTFTVKVPDFLTARVYKSAIQHTGRVTYGWSGYYQLFKTQLELNVENPNLPSA